MLHAGRVWAFYYIRLGPVARRPILGLPGLPRQLHAVPMLHAGRVWAFYYIRWGPELMVWINCGLDKALNTLKFYLCEVLSLLNEGMWCFFGLEDGLFEQLPIQQRTKRTSANWTIILLNIQLLNIHISRNYKTIVKKMNVEKLNVELTKCSIGILGNWLNGKRQMLNRLFVQYFLVNVTCSNAFGGSTGHRWVKERPSEGGREEGRGQKGAPRRCSLMCSSLSSRLPLYSPSLSPFLSSLSFTTDGK